ncbi:MAG: major capsid protein [Microviridae sp.]|nr:MAG: major capsid protein [Microviridae sp.]
MKKTLGGDRLGSGKKMEVNLHGYERSTHDMGYIWRSTMSAGTLVPFLCEPVLPGDTFDIGLACEIMTHPTVGPLFGSFKVQLDVFLCPIRLYQGMLHNNKLGIGMNMANVKLPQMSLGVAALSSMPNDLDNAQINPSCILSYLGIRGVGFTTGDPSPTSRNFNAVPLLAYWDIYKNYYSNKQEEIGGVIHQTRPTTVTTVTSIVIYQPDLTGGQTLPQSPSIGGITFEPEGIIRINYTGASPLLETIMFVTNTGQEVAASIAAYGWVDDGLNWQGTIKPYTPALVVNNWKYIDANQITQTAPIVELFDLNEIDTMRENILAAASSTSAFSVNAQGLKPYKFLFDNITNKLNTQEGLGIKTYQSDLFNNWLSTEWIDGTNGINEITAIDTSGGSFTIDTLNLSKKVYDMLNRIAVSGGTYDDWLDAVYTHDRYKKSESPMYMGGLIKELVFQEVVSNSGTSSDGSNQPLGTLGGRGVMGKKHKGGDVTVKVDEPSYIIGIISLTPRLDYSQGNKWDTHLATMDDFHKPALDEIGFQELITEQMAWWDTKAGLLGTWTQKSAGKQPAWINYMTNVNQTRGNFAIKDNEMFMTLNRRYECDVLNDGIKDLTTYIDPTKFNDIFAETSIDAQNFWTQIAVDITARRKMSAKVMPNL